MLYRKFLLVIGCAAIFVAGVVFGQLFDGLRYSSQEIPAVEAGANGTSGVNSGDPGPFPVKDWQNDPFAQGNAPQGGGPNAEAGPDILLDPSEMQHPPSQPRINPLPPGEEKEAVGVVGKCSQPPVYSNPGVNPVITFTVPSGWSVWKCIEERFPEYGDRFVLGAVENLQWYIDYDKTLTTRNANIVPVGYVFMMGGDGGGALPGKQ